MNRHEPLEPLDPDDLAALGETSTATITTQLFKRGLRNTYLVGPRCLTPEAPKMVGEAFTLRYIPAREDLDTVETFDDYDHPQRKAIELVGPGQVLVSDCRGVQQAAAGGHILLTRMAARGAAGFVADGALRDVAGIVELPLPIYAVGPAAMINLAQHHAVDFQVPIGCAGVPVYPGDVMVGDADGVVCVPRHLVDAIAGSAREQEELEVFIQAQVRGGAPLRGTYPPDAETLQEHVASRSSHRGQSA